ncbi:hypothetical protein D3C76_540330 [compost metagenome]|uniref:Uncharacterized membrane protein YqjE n=2 Tax=Pseudomonas jinjuensis TaxID=198616 RepID=A0A1H0AI37_9PSED|nr:Uncharacterized membrane protein YqjE [Pseudomonas jinjuensis]
MANTPSLRRFFAAFLGLLHGHIELLGIELQEQKSRTFQLLMFAGLALVFALLLLAGISMLVLILFWDTYRVQAAIGLCLFYGIGCAICAWRIHQLADDDTSPFSATLEELARDQERLLP